MTPLFKELDLHYSKEMELNDNEYSVYCSSLGECWQEADHFLICLDKLHSFDLDISISSLTFADFFAVITFAYTELQALPFSCAPLYLRICDR